MKAWMLSIAELVRPWMGRSSVSSARWDRRKASSGSTRQARTWSPGATAGEVLEGRALLTATSVVPFATLTGQVTATNQPSQVVLHIDAGELRSDQSPTVVVGFAVAAADGSSVSPEMTKVTGPNGQITPLMIPPHGNTAADKLARQTHLFARVIPLATTAQDITLNVSTLNKTTGNYIVEAYLAGDATGDGNVDASDLAVVQAAYGSQLGQVNYTAAADFNGDGRVGCIDRKLTEINQGAHVIVPVAIPTAFATTTTPTSSTTIPYGEVNLAPTAVAVPAATAATPIAIATPVSFTTPVASTTAVGTANYVPVTLTPSSAIPVAATSTTTPVVLTPVYPATTSTGSSTGTTTTSTTGATATPVYLVAQPAGTTTSAAAAPIYLYGQPVVAGATSASYPAYSTPGATLFGQTTSGQVVGTATPLPVYLYNTPTTPAAT